jgi:hypothetical protein
MKNQMKAIDLHARKLGDEHLVPGAAARVRFCQERSFAAIRQMSALPSIATE